MSRRATRCVAESGVVLLTLLTLLTWLGATSSAEAQSTGTTVRDSGGVRIVDNARPAWSARTAWTLSAAPVLTIGTTAGGEAHFGRIAGATRLRDGRIVVAERASLQLRTFDSTGRHLRTVGGKGQGPGEFSDIGVMMRLPGDSLAVESMRYSSIFAPNGEFVRQVRYGPFAPGLLQVPFVAVIGRFDDGSAVVGDFPQGRSVPRGAARWVDSSTFLLVDPSGAVVRDVCQRRRLPQVSARRSHSRLVPSWCMRQPRTMYTSASATSTPSESTMRRGHCAASFDAHGRQRHCRCATWTATSTRG